MLDEKTDNLLNIEILNPNNELGRTILKLCDNRDYKLVAYDSKVISDAWYPQQFTKWGILNNWTGLCKYDTGEGSTNDLFHYKSPVNGILCIARAIKAYLLNQNSMAPWRHKLPKMSIVQEVNLGPTIRAFWVYSQNGIAQLVDLEKLVEYR